MPEFSAWGCSFPSRQPRVTGISTTGIEIMGRVSAFRSPARFDHLHRTHIVLRGRAILYSALLPRVQVPRRFHDKSRSDTDGSIDAYAVSHRDKRNTAFSFAPLASTGDLRIPKASDSSGCIWIPASTLRGIYKYWVARKVHREIAGELKRNVFI